MASWFFQWYFEEEDYYMVNYIYWLLVNLYSCFGDFQIVIGLFCMVYCFFKDIGCIVVQAKVLNDLVIVEELVGELDVVLGYIEVVLNLENFLAKDLVLLYSVWVRVFGVLGWYEVVLYVIDVVFVYLLKVEQVLFVYFCEWEGFFWNVWGSINVVF